MNVMKEKILAFFASLKALWEKAGKKARLIFLGTAAGALALALVVTILLNHKDYVVLYDDLNDAENREVVAALEEATIVYKVENGRVYVVKSDEGKARLQLATLGFSNTGFNYEIYTNNSGLTTTQQQKEQAVLYDLQNRLQATIELFPEVRKAVVTVSLPEKNAFALQQDEKPASASVTIQKQPGKELTPEQVRGIINIVKDSLKAQGLTEENISIVDERGDLKTTLDLNEDFNNKKIKLTEEVNRSAKNRIVEAVSAPYGSENVRVVVSTTLNTDSRVAEQITYQPIDPENPTNNPLDYAEIDRQKAGDGFAAAQGVPGAQDNVGTPQYAAQEAEANASNNYSSHDTWDYLVSSLKEQFVKDGFVIEKASASIIINKATLAEGERDQIIALASNASGIPAESITVQNLAFYSPEIIDGPIAPNFTQIAIFTGVGLLVLCIIVIIVLTVVSRRNKARLAAEAAAAQALALENNPYPLLTDEGNTFEPITLSETPEQKLKAQIKDLAESDPEIVAQLIKTWLIGKGKQ